MKRAESNSDSPAVLDTLGARIKAVRVRWRWSQEEMAEALRVDQASISFWERNKIVPSGSALVALAALFRSSVTALEKGEGFIMPESPNKMDGSGKAIRGELPRSVALPFVQGGDVLEIIDLKDGSTKTQPLSEAMMVMVQGVKEGRRVWVVMD